MPSPTNPGNRQARLERAGQVLDRWLALFERTLDEVEQTEGTLPKSTDFLSLFRACQLLLQLEDLASRLSTHEPSQTTAWSASNTNFDVQGGFEDDGA